MPEPLDDTEELATEWHDLLGRYHRTMCALDRALVADHGLSVSDFEILQQLHAASSSDEGRVRLHDLGDQVHLSQSALSRLITRLEKSGLVSRCVCEDDRRSVWTAITAAGSERFLEARPTHRSILLELADDSPAVDDHCTS
jgi:DNA-binding MarR family transcriptional regulator